MYKWDESNFYDRNRYCKNFYSINHTIGREIVYFWSRLIFWYRTILTDNVRSTYVSQNKDVLNLKKKKPQTIIANL